MKYVPYLVCYFFGISITFLFSSERCVNIHLDIRTRPDLSASYISENANFQIHYDIEGINAPSLNDENGNDIPDYIESVAEIAEDSRYKLVNIMGYLEEPNDVDELYDIYILNQSAWGWNIVEDTNTGSSYVKIDNDYSGNNFNSEYCLNNLDKMKISVAHEYFHAVQRAYRPNPATDHDFFLEMSSMWFEDLMVPDCNDYLSFVDALSYSIFNNPTQKFDGSDLTSGQSSANFGYSMALFAHYLTNSLESTNDSFGTTIIRQIWINYSSGVSARDAIIQTIENEFNDSFSRVWTDFISYNMFCGYFNYFNQDFYFYSDQQYIEPISINPSDYIFSNESELYTISLDPYSANIFVLGVMEDLSSESSVSNPDNSIGYYSIIGPSNKSHNKVNDGPNQLNLNSGDKYYFVLSSILGETDVEISFESEDLPHSGVVISDIYPNPSSSDNAYFNIQNNFDIYNLKIEFYNVAGELVSSLLDLDIKQGSSDISIPLSKHLDVSGVYILVFLDGDDRISEKKITFIK